LPVEPLGRCRDAENFRARQGGDDLAPRAGECVMGLIDDEKIGAGESIEPANERRDAGDLYRQQWRLWMPGGDNAVNNTKRVERFGNLIDDLLPMAENYNAIAALDGTGHDGGE
jgi:hypothetical protein